MKKVFIFFGIFAACLILCLCALGACDQVGETAEALISVGLPNSGIVRRNELSFNDFSSIVYGGSVDSSFTGLYVPDAFLSNVSYNSANNTFDYSFNFLVSNGSSVEYFCYLYFTPSLTGYYYFTCHGSCDSNNGVSFYIYDDLQDGNDGGSSILGGNNKLFLSTVYPLFMSFNAGTRYLFKFGATYNMSSNLDTSGVLHFDYLKLEYSSSRATSSASAFTGFVIPGITYDDSGSGGGSYNPWENWDGFVNPNYLYNSSKFSADDLNGWDIVNGTYTVEDDLLNISTDISSSCTLINTTTKGFYYSQGQKITLACYIPSLEGSARMSVTNAAATVLGSAATSVELNEGLNWAAFELSASSETDGIPYLMIVLDHESDMSLEWVKLELGDLFTGYTEDDTYFSNWDGVVRGNVSYNTSDFADLEYWSAPALTSIGNYNIITSGTPNNYLLYNGSNKTYTCFEGDYFTLACYIESSVGDPSNFVPVNPDGSTITDVMIINDGDEQLHLGLNYISYLYTGSSTIYPNFGIEVGGTLTISWVKVEIYPMFTGYFRNESEIRYYALRNYINSTNGWTRQVFFTNYTSADHTSDFILSPTATVEYALGDGVSFISSDDTATYTLSYHTITTSPENRTLTMGIGYKQGTFSTGDISLSVKYQWYELENGAYQLYDQTLLFSLQPYEVFVYTFEQIYDYPSISFTCSEGSDFTLQAIKLENGNDFTLFPDGTSASFEGYNNGFASGQTYGYDKGYKQATADLKQLYYDTGYQEGYGAGKTQGYSDGITDFGDGNSTWVSMLSAFIDVPIQAIRGFFDVEIFGFNFLNLFKMLVLISVLVYVIKFLVGKYA